MREVLQRPYPVKLRGEDRTGVVFAWTKWGNDRIRWYWVRHDDDGSEKAYSGAQLVTA